MEAEVLSSLSDLENFKKSTIWKDMEDTITLAIEEAYKDIEDEENVLKIYRLQGEIKRLRSFYNLLDVIIEDKKISVKLNKRKG